MNSTSASVETQHRNVFVLSGGAARGAVQVGMLEVLIGHGIVPHAFVGTSVGALNAAFMGWRPDSARVRELRGKWLQMSTRDIFPGGTLARVGHLLRQRPYLFSSAALARLIEDWRPVEMLEDLPVPVRVVTTPLAGDGAVYHRHGRLSELLLASAAVPAVFAPVVLPASCGFPGPHVDGGVSDLVPVRGRGRPRSHPRLRAGRQRPRTPAPRAYADRHPRRQHGRRHARQSLARPRARRRGPPDDHPRPRQPDDRLHAHASAPGGRPCGRPPRGRADRRRGASAPRAARDRTRPRGRTPQRALAASTPRRLTRSREPGRPRRRP